MTRVTGSYGRPVHGVSQLPDTSKLVGQCRAQENCVPDLVDGLRKRQGTRNIIKILESLDPDSFVHIYTRDETETYIMIFEPDQDEFKIFDLSGTAMNITYETVGYNNTDNPRIDFKVQTISDFTFLVNSVETVRYTDDYSENDNNNTAVVEVKFATYGRTYTIYGDGTPVGVYEAPTGEDVDDIDLVDTSYVAARLAEGSLNEPISESLVTVTYNDTLSSHIITVNELVSSVSICRHFNSETKDINVLGVSGNIIMLQGGGGNNGVSVGDKVDVTYVAQGAADGWDEYEISRTINTLYIRRKDGEAFTLSTEDGADGADLVGVVNTVSSVAKLPARAPIGFKIKVSNSSQDESDDYWLVATEDDTSEDETLWTEATDDGIQNTLDRTSMPHVIVRDSVVDGIANFTFRQGEWEDREVGSILNNPDPSFVGSKISGIGTFQNRLFLVSDDSVNMTRNERFFDFYRYTAKVQRDDDPIQVGADSDRVDILDRHAYLHGDIIFFSTFAQYRLYGGDVITTENVKLEQVNSYPNTANVTPANIGNALIFPVEAGTFTGFREYRVNGDTEIREALSITDHVSQYIPSNIKLLDASPTTDILMAASDLEPENIYIYNWKINSEGKIQAAWHRWTFHGVTNVIKIYMIKDYVYFIFQRDEGVFIEKMSLQADVAEDSLPYTLRLDRRHTTTAERYGFKWIFDIGFELNDIDRLVAIKGTGTWAEEFGASVPVTKESILIDGVYVDKYVTIDDLAEGDTCELIIGTRFDSSYIPPSPRVIDGSGRPSEIERLQVAKLHIGYERTGSLDFFVRDSYRGSSYQSTFNGRKIGAPNNTVGYSYLLNGTWSIPIRHEATYLEMEIQANGFLPFNIKHIEWEGKHQQRGRRY